ncbi:sulfatase [Novosphingobium sp. KN65.2]|uniref:sulfatase family protein n=1 Tax=Novosphingobium sp. KN65.2 TaxID=1478134 RepID=UPI0005E53125|nr:sulfatase [Novosphingobium sp. KN65.2]CDO38335.1 putative N-acetylglucosamine-6-sulfatase [Novosphingobium sp. KN65.2]
MVKDSNPPKLPGLGRRPKKLFRAIVLAGAAAMAAVSPVSAKAPAQTPVAESARSVPQAEHQQMNMIFVLVDDLRFDAMGFLTPGLQTPNIDYLARNGTYFPNAVVTSSLCSPSRATILTGETARNHGVIDNSNSSEKGLTFFPSYLQQAGYQTAFFGKWHMGDATDAPRPGFDRWVSFAGQGTYWPTERLSPAEVAAGKRQQLNVDGTHVNRTGYITDELTDYALDWLKQGRDRSRPFFLYLSHKAVHSDPEPPLRYKDQYADLKVTLPASAANTPENNAGKPVWVRNQRNSWHGIDFPYHTDRKMTDYLRDYYATLSPVDESLGKILHYLRDYGLERNTMVVFYSDNGFMVGDHGLIDKRNAYEPSVRVPLLVYAPGTIPAGAVNQALVRNLDLAPTFLEAAGVAKPAQMEGSSFLSLAEGKTAAKDWNPGDFVYEYYWDVSFPQTPTTFAIERDGMKYIQYHGIWDIEELYDVRHDPEEMHNLIDDPKHLETKVTLRKALFDQLANRQGEHHIPYTEKFSEGIVKRNVDGPHAADFPADWYTKPNLPTAFNGYYRDTPEKLKADEEGKTYIPGGRSGE